MVINDSDTTAKIAVVSDIHLKLSRNVEFETLRFIKLFDHLVSKAYVRVVIAGDLFDTARPSLEEIKLVTEQLLRLSEVSFVYIIAGNHEAVSHTLTTYDFLPVHELCRVEVIKNGIINTEVGTIRLIDWALVRKYTGLQKTDILISHFRSNYGIIKEEISTRHVATLSKLTILGDIHHPYSPMKNVVYCSSPYSTKYVTREKNQYGYIEILSSTEIKRVFLDLPNKIKVELSADRVEQYVKQYSDDLLHIIVKGNLLQLQKLPQYDNVRYTTINTETTVQGTDTSAGEISTKYSIDIVDSIAKFVPESMQIKVIEVLNNLQKEIK